MKRITFGGLALVFAALFGMVQLGSPTAFARPDSTKAVKKTQPKYRVRGIPGLTEQAKKSKKAKKKVVKEVKSSLQHQNFLGKITHKNGKYVLTAGLFTFKLSNQAQVKKYSGKRVQVTGKLNPLTNKIQVAKIKKARV